MRVYLFGVNFNSWELWVRDKSLFNAGEILDYHQLPFFGLPGQQGYEDQIGREFQQNFNIINTVLK